MNVSSPKAYTIPGVDLMQAAITPPPHLTPLHLAPTPESPWRAFFSDAVIEAHLDRLVAGQQDDGGWPITWDPTSEASRCEWRAIWTVEAVSKLAAYGRLG